MTANALVRAETSVPSTLGEIKEYAQLFAQSGFFADSRQMAQAAVKIIAGRELNIPAFAAMNGIHIIQGKAAPSANIQASLVKASGRYDYRVIRMDDDEVAIDFFQRAGDTWEKIGTSAFTKADAIRAGTQNMGKFPRNMLFARALSNGVKWYCPDVSNGVAMYTPGELGAEEDEYGNISPIPQPAAQPAAQPAPANVDAETGEVLDAEFADDPQQPTQPHIVAAAVTAAWAASGLKLGKEVMSRVLHRGVTDARDAFANASQDDLRRLLYYAQNHGAILPPAEAETEAEAA